MEVSEITDRYKGLPRWSRNVIAAVLGIMPSFYFFYSQADDLQIQLDDVRLDEGVQRGKFDKARVQKAKLPELESQLGFTEDQLKKAQERLPDSFAVDSLLEKTARAAMDSGVEMRLFAPDKEITAGAAVKYKLLPVRLEAWGEFHQIAAFYDRLVHLDQIVHLRAIDLSSQLKLPDTLKPQRIVRNDDSPTREDTIVRAVAQVAVFRSLRDGEAAAETAAEKRAEKPKPAEKPSGNSEERK